MTTIINSTATTSSAPVSFEVLLAKMLPYFRRYARRFDKSRRFSQEDVIQELTGIALEMYTSLVRRGKEAFYSPIMRFSIQRFHQGRRFTGMNSTDILSEHAQMLGRSEVCHLSKFDNEEDRTKNLDTQEFMEDRRVSVFDTVQFKIDFEDWFQQQAPRDRQIITDLSYGETTGTVARKYRVSDGLISQYRKRYANSWKRFIDPEEKGMLVPA